MSTASPSPTCPAQLGFIAIFNPSLAQSEESLDDQIVYYASIPVLSRRQRQKRSGRVSSSKRNPAAAVSQAERYERVRQIGLARGIVDFAKGFSGGRDVDALETERSRMVMKEVEEGWWILAVGFLGE
jgi:hypothetical protein